MDDPLQLWDYRRRVADSYRRVRTADDPAAAWEQWQRDRDELFARHPESPFAPERQVQFAGLDYFPYDPDWRLEATVEPLEGGAEEVGHSGEGTTRFLRFGVLTADSPEGRLELSLFWLDTYGGGVFVPFRDATSGHETYGGGRYLLDTVKGADLGHTGDRIVADFNFAYHPSCVHDHRWSCPLAPRSNHLGFPVRAGERLTAGTS